MNLTFSSEQLQRLFQYYIILDKNLVFLYCSDNILGEIEFVEDLSLTDVFSVISLEDAGTILGLDTLLEPGCRRVMLQLHTNRQATLTGSLEYISTSEQFLFYREATARTDESLEFEGSFNALPDQVNLQDIVHSIPSEISVFNVEGQYQYVNASAESDAVLRKWLVGKNDEELAVLKNIPHKVTTNRKDLFNKVLATKKSVSWEEALTENGNPAYYLRTFFPILGSDGKVKSVIRYGLNITERKRMEDQLLQNGKRYHDLYSFSPILIYSHSLTGQILSCNPAVLNTLDYSEEEILKMNIKDLIPSFDLEKINKEYLAKINQEYYSEGIFRIVPRGGNKLVYLYYQNYKIVEEASSFIIGFSHNITARIKAEKKLRISKLVTENLAKQKEIFLANMSHEIRTPINGILGLNNLLLKTNLDKQQEKYVKLTSESINNLLIIINDVLDIEKIAFGKVSFEKNPFNVYHKVSRIIQLFQYKAAEKNLEIVHESTIPSDLVVNGDQFRLTQILSNLLSNAIKFSRAGTIKLSVRITWEQEEQITLEFGVKDTGIGIGKEDIGKIFKPFEQASLKTTRKYGGTGLGLSICKKLTEMQGGNIRVVSELGKGAEFLVTLPYQLNTGFVEEQTTTGSGTSFSRLAGRRILVGEDVELNQFLVENLLESWGCEVDLVDNGVKLIEKLMLHDYDIILMDIQMPVMDGLTAAEHIRKMDDPRKANTPILAFTASVMSEDIDTYKKVGMNDFILKPYSELLLYERLTSVLPKSDDMATDRFVGSIPVESPAHNKLYDLSDLRALTGEDGQRLNKLVAMLIKTLSSEIENIQIPGASNDWQQVSKIVHKLKTSLIHIRVDSLKDILPALERNYMDYSNEELTSFLNQFSDTVGQVITGLKADLASHDGEVRLTE